MGRIIAAADIGSNTVHLLIAESDGETVTRLENEGDWISLGTTVARDGSIPQSVSAHLKETLMGFKRLAKVRKVECLYVFATEAMRLAKNHDQIIEDIYSSTGIVVDLITPRREAELGLIGAMSDSPANLDLLIEIGGGSAQVSGVSDGKLTESCSLPIGTGRLIAEAGLKNPATHHTVRVVEDYVQAEISKIALGASMPPKLAVACGGVARGLWRALHPDGDKVLHQQELAYIAWAASQNSVTKLAARFKVKNRRASTLLPGALAYLALMERLQISDLQVSEFGVREGAVLQIVRGEIQGCLM